MLKRISLLTVMLFTGLIAVEQAYTSSGGPPAGHTGAPGESTCISCHGGSSLNPGNAVRTLVFNGNASLTSYVPGTTYTVVYTVNNPATTVFGFQMIAKRANGTNAGSFVVTSPTQTQLVSGYLQQTFSGTQASPAGSKSWSFSWTAPAAGAGTVSFYVATNVADGNGGSSGDQIYTNVFTLSEAVASASIASPTVPASAYCVGATLQLTFNATGTFGSGNVFTAQLSDANGNFSAATNIGSLSSLTPAPISVNIPTGAAAGTGYKIRVVASNPATTGAESIPFSVSIPAATPVISSDGFSLTSTGSGSFVWFFNGNPISGATSASYTPTQLGSYTVGIENNGCSPSISAPFTVAALISGVQQPTTPAVCEETSLLRGFNTLGNFDTTNQFTLILVANNGTETPLATTLTTSSSLLALLPPGLTGNGFRYRLRASSPLALSALSNTFEILPNPPAATISQAGFTLSSSATQGNNWYKDGAPISGADQQTYTVTENGEYSVRYSANNCQSPFSNSITITNVSVVDQAHPGFRIFPNPVQEVLQLVAPEAGHMQVRDLQGRNLLQQSLEAGNHELALGELAAGLYVLYWEDSRGTSLRRFVKQ
jgi:hypothetical protein